MTLTLADIPGLDPVVLLAAAPPAPYYQGVGSLQHRFRHCENMRQEAEVKELPLQADPNPAQTCANCFFADLTPSPKVTLGTLTPGQWTDVCDEGHFLLQTHYSVELVNSSWNSSSVFLLHQQLKDLSFERTTETLAPWREEVVKRAQAAWDRFQDTYPGHYHAQHTGCALCEEDPFAPDLLMAVHQRSAHRLGELGLLMMAQGIHYDRGMLVSRVPASTKLHLSEPGDLHHSHFSWCEAPDTETTEILLGLWNPQNERQKDLAHVLEMAKLLRTQT